MGINKAILVGNLGKDPELKYTPSGQPVATFTLATSERFVDKGGQKQERTEWHNIVVWGKLAEVVNQYLKKGRPAYIEGRISTRSWDDRDGNKKYRTEIVATTVEFIGGNAGGGSSGGGNSGSVHADPGAPEVPSYDMGPAGQDPMADDLPF
ncbi:MAG TPA: single-stranded DNA-binding protein [Chitinispirillaceae bacterium]|nr:single-stranded DNA-binding protein [Chitinispirillaceae bacterium]